MRRHTIWIETYLVALAAVLIIVPTLKAADNPDSGQVSILLAEAKTQAFRLSADAAEMESFTWTAWPMSWQSHTEALLKIKNDVNALGSQLVKLEDARQTASPWQKAAIDRIAPLLSELASNTTGAIDLLNNNAANLTNVEYVDYVEANADTAAHLANLVADFVDYSRTRQRLESLKHQLELKSRP